MQHTHTHNEICTPIHVKTLHRLPCTVYSLILALTEPQSDTITLTPSVMSEIMLVLMRTIGPHKFGVGTSNGAQ